MGVFPAFSRAFARPYMGGVPTPPPMTRVRPPHLDTSKPLPRPHSTSSFAPGAVPFPTTL